MFSYMPSEMLAATEDHATFTKATTLEGLRGDGTAPLGTRRTSFGGVFSMLLLVVVGVDDLTLLCGRPALMLSVC